jgi:hypothetical protein
MPFSQSLWCQSFTFHGGIKPNNLLGTHFSAKADVIEKHKWLYSINYSFVKYKDMFSHPRNLQPNFHIENKRDQTIFPFQQLRRGTIIQVNERDFRPRDLIHRFSLFMGYKFIDSPDFTVKVFCGPHYSTARNILYYIAYNDAEVIVNQGDVTRTIPYHDFQVFRTWDIGIGGRMDAEYKVFKNVHIGLSGQMFFDAMGESIDLILGGGISYHFNIE